MDAVTRGRRMLFRDMRTSTGDSRFLAFQFRAQQAFDLVDDALQRGFVVADVMHRDLALRIDHPQVRISLHAVGRGDTAIGHGS